MRIFGYATDPEDQWTSPLPTSSRFFKLRLLGGDYCAPKNANGGYDRPKLWHLRRAFFSLPVLPFASWRYPFTRHGGYAGFKAWGIDGAADVAAYAKLIGSESAPAGSRALHLSARFWADVPA